MQTIGMLGGMSWESTALYYRSINELVRQALGGLHSAKIVMHSVDFHTIEALQRAAQWDQAGALLGQAAQGLQQAGADFIIICTNTMHRVAPQISHHIDIPILHLADATAARLKQAGFDSVGLLARPILWNRIFIYSASRRKVYRLLSPVRPSVMR